MDLSRDTLSASAMRCYHCNLRYINVYVHIATSSYLKGRFFLCFSHFQSSQLPNPSACSIKKGQFFGFNLLDGTLDVVVRCTCFDMFSSLRILEYFVVFNIK